MTSLCVNSLSDQAIRKDRAYCVIAELTAAGLVLLDRLDSGQANLAFNDPLIALLRHRIRFFKVPS